jgi:hypothetical protein
MTILDKLQTHTDNRWTESYERSKNISREAFSWEDWKFE